MAKERRHELRELLHDRFGLEAFRPGQEDALRAVLAGRDAMLVLSTGAGKSLVFQLASLMLSGATVVVSPLIALMKDQEEGLADRGISTAVVESGRPDEEIRGSLEDLREGRLRLLYTTPESLQGDLLQDMLKGVETSLLVVDEAHSISQWGHSFRPAYLGLAEAAGRLGRPPILALTATATPWVRGDIIEGLGLRDPAVIVHGTDRPNLFLEVRRVARESEDRQILKSLFSKREKAEPAAQGSVLEGSRVSAEMANSEGAGFRLQGDVEIPDFRGPGIIYTSTTAAARKTAEWLREWGIAADYYHGRRRRADRERVQEDFMSGRLEVVAATNAFGLGIDKPDMRFVIHRDVPASLEAYYQEAGRAGRDSESARCLLLFRSEDLGRSTFLSAGGHLTWEEVLAAVQALSQLPKGRREFSRRGFQSATGLGGGDAGRLWELLRDNGLAQEHRGRLRVPGDLRAEDIPLVQEERREAYEKSRADMVRGYAETAECRRRFLLAYFAEDYGREPCGFCDNDLAAANEPEGAHGTASNERGGRVKMGSAEEAGVVRLPFSAGDIVSHEEWGQGVVQLVSDDRLTVLFDDVGYRTLDGELVVERELLRKEEDR